MPVVELAPVSRGCVAVSLVMVVHLVIARQVNHRMDRGPAKTAV